MHDVKSHDAPRYSQRDMERSVQGQQIANNRQHRYERKMRKFVNPLTRVEISQHKILSGPYESESSVTIFTVQFQILLVSDLSTVNENLMNGLIYCRSLLTVKAWCQCPLNHSKNPLWARCTLEMLRQYPAFSSTQRCAGKSQILNMTVNSHQYKYAMPLLGI